MAPPPRITGSKPATPPRDAQVIELPRPQPEKKQPADDFKAAPKRNPTHPELRAIELPDEDLASPANLKSVDDQRMLIGDAGQVNDVSEAAGNADDLCSAASVVNAMILAGDQPGASAANARALRVTAQSLGGFDHLPPTVKRANVDRALEHLAAGKLTTFDAQNLQQLVYASLTNTQGSAGGIAPHALTSLLSQLGASGANLDGARFVQVASNPKDPDFTHWLVESSGLFANSNPAQTGPMNAENVAMGSRSSKAWRADVQLKGTRVEAGFIDASNGRHQRTAFVAVSRTSGQHPTVFALSIADRMRGNAKPME